MAQDPELANRVCDLYCSWCFQKTNHDLMEKNRLGRDVYQCQGKENIPCFKSTVKCLKCKEMARVFYDTKDKLCYKCSGTIEEWENAKDLSQKGYCSWCFKESNHTRMVTNYIERDIYSCDNCSQRTLKCGKSPCENFTRGVFGSYDEKWCYVCNGTIPSWTDEESIKEKTTATAWCSWCFEKGEHILKERNLTSRNIYQCSKCSQRTLGCLGCKEGAMTRGGPKWDDALCAYCCWETAKGGWEAMVQIKTSVQALENPLEELKKPTEHREDALGAGMIRPYLLLISMDTDTRAGVASHLGWTTFTEPSYGNSGKEAWEIIHSAHVGLQSRANYSYEKINFFGTSCNWYDILTRVGENVMGVSVGIEDATTEKKHDMCTNPDSTDILTVENNFMKEFFNKMREKMNPKLVEKLITLRDSEESNEKIREINAKLREHAGISHADSLLYAYNVLSQVATLQNHVPTIISLLGQSIDLAQFLADPDLYTATGYAVNLLHIGWLASPLFVIGIAYSAYSAFTATLGSTEERLLIPVLMLLNQKIFLALQGLNLKEFYKVQE